MTLCQPPLPYLQLLTLEEHWPFCPYFCTNQITFKIYTLDYNWLKTNDGVTDTWHDEVVWYLALNRVSTRSDVDNSASRIYFKITLADACHDVHLTASEPLTGGYNRAMTVYLFDLWTISH